MPTKTINLNVEMCDSGVIITDTDDGCKNAYSNEREACRSIANDIVYILEEMCDSHYRIKIDITPIEE